MDSEGWGGESRTSAGYGWRRSSGQGGGLAHGLAASLLMVAVSYSDKHISPTPCSVLVAPLGGDRELGLDLWLLWVQISFMCPLKKSCFFELKFT